MDVPEAIRTLRAVRSFQEKPVPDDVIRDILEAGRLSASASNAQPWHFIVVENRETLKQIGQIATTGPYVAEAPVAIVVTIPHKVIAVSDASRAIQSMLLTAWSRGVGGNWVGFRGMPEIKPLLGIPDEIDVLAVLPFGYPASSPGHGKKQRKLLKEVVSRERFGQPFE
jgi:nitroreductase